jgi:cytochrome c-type biogenesis protein CcmI
MKLDAGVQRLMRAAEDADEPEEITSSPAKDPANEVLRMRREAAEQAAQNARLELEQLKKLLNEQENARRHAQKTAAYAHRQLQVFEEDSRRVREELSRTREQLTLTKQEQNIERQQAARLEASLKNELLEARSNASTAQASASGYRTKWLVIVFVVLVPAIVWAVVTYWHPGGSSAGQTAGAAVADSAPSTALAAGSTAGPAAALAISPNDFSGALSRLDSALGAFKGVAKPEEILRAIHKENAAKGVHVCSFEWNNGQISLSFGSGDDSDPEAAIMRCADAVEKLAARK